MCEPVAGGEAVPLVCRVLAREAVFAFFTAESSDGSRHPGGACGTSGSRADRSHSGNATSRFDRRSAATSNLKNLEPRKDYKGKKNKASSMLHDTPVEQCACPKKAPLRLASISFRSSRSRDSRRSKTEERSRHIPVPKIGTDCVTFRSASYHTNDARKPCKSLLGVPLQPLMETGIAKMHDLFG
jgi:hypothetical protein